MCLMARESCFSVFPSSSWHQFESVSIYLGFMNDVSASVKFHPLNVIDAISLIIERRNWHKVIHGMHKGKKNVSMTVKGSDYSPSLCLVRCWQFSIDCLKYLNWCPSFLSAAKCWKGIEFGWMDWNVDVVQWTLSPSPQWVLC